ncbi:MAG: TonB-dependent receptor [Bacteroidota bacterium]
MRKIYSSSQVLILILFLWVIGGKIQANTPILVSGVYVQTPLKKVFQEWEQKYGVFFSYKKQLIEGYTVTLSLQSSPLPEALEQTLENLPLRGEIREEKFILITAKASTPYLCGWLIDEDTGDPISFAALRTSDGRRGTLSKEDGSFYLKGPFGSAKELIITHIAYQEYRLRLSPYPTPCRTLSLQPKAREMKAITISEYLTDGIHHDHRSVDLQPKRIGALPGLTEPDIFRMVQVLPGINNPDGTATGLNIRGGTPDQTLVQYNDIPLYQTGHFFDMIPSINPYAVDGAQVFRGGFDASQAGRVSGLVNITQGDSIPMQGRRGVNMNFTHMGLDIQQPLVKKKLAIYLSGRRSLTDVFPSIAFNRLEERIVQGTRIGDQQDDDGLLKESNIYSFQDASAKLIYRPSKQHYVAASAMLLRNNLFYEAIDLADERVITDDLFVQQSGLSASWHFRPSPQYTIYTKGNYTRFRTDYNFVRSFLESDEDFENSVSINEVVDASLSHHHIFRVNESHLLKAGYEWNHLETFLGLQNESVFSMGGDTTDDIATTHTLFLHYGYSPTSRLLIQAGLRGTFHDQFYDIFLSPRLDFFYSPTSSLTLKGYAGEYFQYISQLVDWDFDLLSSQAWLVSSPGEIPIISSFQVGGGFLFERKGWLVDVEYYLKDLNNLTSFGSNLSSSTNLEFAVGEAYIQGIDVLLKRRWNAQHRSWISYTLSSTTYEFPDLEEEPFRASHDQRHNLQFHHMARWRKWEFSLGWMYRSSKPFTPLVSNNSVQYEDDLGPFWITEPVLGAINSDDMDRDYHRLDLSIMRNLTFTSGDKIRGKIGLSIQNVYNRYNLLSIQYLEDFHEFDTPAAERTAFEIEKDMLFFTPNLLFRLEW